MKAAKFAATFFFLVLWQSALADSAVQEAQEKLKEQGFYYGQISGERDADTTAAIRRFQIRNGLQVTGELNDETVRALRSDSSSAVVRSATPAPADTNDLRAPSNNETNDTPAPQPPRIQPGRVVPNASGSDIFSNTPYENAPPDLQRNVIMGAQSILRRRGFLKGEIDGVYGRELEFSLRALQSQTGISPSGKLDMETLSVLGLLPGQHGHALGSQPRRRATPDLRDEPPVRGQWIRERRPDND